MNVRTLSRVVRRRWLTLAVIPLLVLGLGTLLTALTPPVYQSSTETFFSAAGGSSNSDMVSGTTYAQNQVASYMEIATSQLVLGPVAAQIGDGTTAADLAQRVDVSIADGTAVMTIAASGSTPEDAARLAGAVTTEFNDTIQQMESQARSDESAIEATVIREASVPEAPSSPVVWRNLLLSLLVGIALALLAVFLKERSDPVVRSVDELEELTSLPLLARIPTGSRKDEAIVGGTPGEPRVEAFNTLRTNLQFVQAANATKAFVITSARAGEGKTVTVANLAASMDGTGRRVLVIEADLRRPRLAHHLGLPGWAGLTNVLVGTAELDDVLQPYGHEDVWVLAAGTTPPNPVELLASPAMTQLIQTVSERFDLVLIDAPPLLPVADATILSQQAGTAIILVGLGIVERQDLDRCLESLAPVDAEVVGLIVNRVPEVETNGTYTYRSSPAPVAAPADAGASTRPGEVEA